MSRDATAQPRDENGDARFVSAPRWARVLVILSWVVAIVSVAGFWLREFPHWLKWVALFVVFFLQITSGNFLYENRATGDLRKKMQRRALNLGVGALTGFLLLFLAFMTIGALAWPRTVGPVSGAILVGFLCAIPISFWLHHDVMMVTGRYQRDTHTPEATAKTEPNKDDLKNYVSAPWRERLLFLFGVAWILCLPGWLFSLSSFLGSAIYLSVAVHRSLPYEKYRYIRRPDRSKSDKFLAVFAVMIGAVLGIWFAVLTFDGILTLGLRRWRPTSFGEAWFLLFAYAIFVAVLVWQLFKDLMIVCGWCQKDLVAEQASIAAKEAKKQLKAAPEHCLTCVDCGLTMRPGRDRCHFCGGKPAEAQLAQ